MLRTIAHPTRLKILKALVDGSLCVKDLNSLVSVPQPYLSQHMAVLRKAMLVDNHSDGPLRCYYLLRPTLVRELIRLLSCEHPIRYRNRSEVQREAKSPNRK